jgi:hypothetical protein
VIAASIEAVMQVVTGLVTTTTTSSSSRSSRRSSSGSRGRSSRLCSHRGKLPMSEAVWCRARWRLQ